MFICGLFTLLSPHLRILPAVFQKKKDKVTDDLGGSAVIKLNKCLAFNFALSLRFFMNICLTI